MKNIFKVLSIMMLLLTVGCSNTDIEVTDEANSKAVSSEEAQNESQKDELVFVNFRDIRDLNPHLYAGEMYAQEILYETLISLDGDGYKPCLAESWEMSEDGCVYTFNIRSNVYFSDGVLCDAYAIKANFDAILENKERHAWIEWLKLLDDIQAPDENTIVISVSELYYPLLTELAVTRPFAMISPEAMIDGSTMNGVEAYIGTGPYVLTEFVTDEYAL